MSLWRRLKYLLPSYRAAEEREMQEELNALQAIAGTKELGNLTRAAENARAVWGWTALNDIAADLKYGFAQMKRNPGFTLTAIVILALGIGLNAMTFAVTNAFWWKSLGIRDGDQLVDAGAMSYADLQDYKARNHSFANLFAFQGGLVSLSDDVSTPEEVNDYRLDAETFSALGVRPVIGRDFQAEDIRSGAPAVVIIGHRTWQNRYGGSPDIAGRSLKLNGVARTIIGVMPPKFGFPIDADMWTPILQSAAGNFVAVGMLRSGTSLKQARADIKAISAQLQVENHLSDPSKDPVLMRYQDRYSPDSTVFVILHGATTLVWLIVCVNLASLLIARSVDRTREIAIRLAIGATRVRIVRQLLVENLLLSLAGGTLGLGIAIAGLRRFFPDDGTGPYWVDSSPDLHVLAYILAIAVLTTLLFGLVPALQISRADVGHRLKQVSTTATIRSRRLQHVLVTVELGLTLVLLISSGLMIRSLIKYVDVDTGIRTQDLLLASGNLSGAKYNDASTRVSFEGRLLEALHALPGLTAVSLGADDAGGDALYPEQGPPVTFNGGLGRHGFGVRAIAPDYFQTLGGGIVRGRDFTEHDGTIGNEVAIVSSRFVSKVWPGGDPIGKRVRTGDGPGFPWLTVIGVSADISIPGAGHDTVLYVPYRYHAPRGLTLMSRGNIAHPALANMLRTAVQQIDPDLPLSHITTMDEVIAEDVRSGFGMLSSLFSTLALIALSISVIGIYGLTAYSVGQRTREIGIRVALGANWNSMVWLFARTGLAQILLGSMLGLLGSFAVTHLLQGMVFDLSPTDPTTFVLACALLGIVMIVACAIPATRAAKVDPAITLRSE